MQNQLEERIDQAFQNADYKLGLDLLRELACQQTDNPDIQHRLAVVEEQIGDPRNAKNAHLRCIELSVNNYLAYVYAGYWFQKNNEIEHAKLLYSYALDINSTLLTMWKSAQHTQETKARLQEASILLRTHFSDLHRQTIIATNGTKSILDSIWTRTHDQAYQFENNGQQPQFFYIPSLAPKAFYDPLQFDWAQLIEENFQTIKTEFQNALNAMQNTARPYLESAASANTAMPDLMGSLNWTAFDLFKEGNANLTNHKNSPKTLQLLAKLPLYGLEQQPHEVFFSLLKAKQHIKPHFGLSNHSLTVHLPISIPENCRLRVGEEWREWEEGKLIIFDDTFDHEAINKSDKDRVVLIFSIWHPELTLEERQDILASFRARKNWLESRTSIKNFCLQYID